MALVGGEGLASRPGRFPPSGKTRYPLYRRLCGPQGRSGQMRKISSPPGFDPRTVQPVASRYTDYATRPTTYLGKLTEFIIDGTRSLTPRLLFTPGKDPVPIVQEAGWAPGPVWTGAENLAFTGIRSPDRPARSQSLYRLRYPAHRKHRVITGKKKFVFFQSDF